MATLQESQPLQEVDLDKTDELPVLDMSKFPHADKEPGATARLDPNATTSDTDRHVRIDLPALIDSVQQAEARIAQQNAHQEILDRELKTSRERIEESTRESLRLNGETQALRATLAAREDALAQAMHTVGDRDHQINELRREHAGLLQKLEANIAATVALSADLGSARTQIEQGRSDLQSAQASISALSVQIKNSENSLAHSQREAALFKKQSTEFLENLQSREWQRSNREDLFREMDGQLAAALANAAKFEGQADALSGKLNAAEAQLDERAQSLRSLQASLEQSAEASKKQLAALEDSERTRQELLLQIKERDAEQSKSSAERTQLADTLSARERALQEEREIKSQLQVQLQSLEAGQAEHMARIAELDRALSAAKQQKRLDDEQIQRQLAAIEAAKSESATHRQRIDKLEGELSATTSLLDEVRRPIEAAEADIQRLRSELDAKSQAFEASEGEVRKLQTALERSRGALEEREFLIRRLERSANNSAQVLGRLQSSIERLGASPGQGTVSAHPTAHPAAPHGHDAPEPAYQSATQLTGSLMRIDNGLATTYALGGRTRLGRSPESDVRIDSSSVSRHHALIVTGAQHAIIEDLNSTNGVIVNGRKINRHKLKDGDVVVIGEAQFKFSDSGSLLPEANPVSFAPS